MAHPRTVLDQRLDLLHRFADRLERCLPGVLLYQEALPPCDDVGSIRFQLLKANYLGRVGLRPALRFLLALH